jgi:hypothetical protein
MSEVKMKERVPAGWYKAKFKGMEYLDSGHRPELAWKFEITEGPYAGREVSEITYCEFTDREVRRLTARKPGSVVSSAESLTENCLAEECKIGVNQNGEICGSIFRL